MSHKKRNCCQMPAFLQGSYGIRHELAYRQSVKADWSVMIKTSFWRSQMGDNERRARHFFSPKMYIRLFIVCSRWKLVIFCAPIKTRSSIQTTAVASSLYVALLGLLNDVSETKKLPCTTWPETHRPGDLESSTGCWGDLCFWPSIYDLLSCEVSCSN